MTEQKIDLEPFGVNDTKRLTVDTAEKALYKEQSFPNGFTRMVDYLGGDQAITHAMTGGIGPSLVGGIDTPALLDSARDMGATNGFKFAQVKMHSVMPIQSALFWVYREDFQLNEYSGRYSVMMDSGRELPKEEIQGLLEKKISGLVSEEDKKELVDVLHDIFSEVRKDARKTYEMLLEEGMAREIARIGLGQGTHTQFYLSGNLEQHMDAITNAKALAAKRPDCSFLGPEAEQFEFLLKQVAPEAVASYNRDQQHKLNPVPIKIDYEKLEQNPDGKPRFGVSKTKRLTNEEAEKLLWVPQKYLDKGWFMATDYSGSDPSVVQSARTSYGSGTTKVSEDKHLTRYLRRHRHTTPSESVEIQYEQKTPVMVWPRQGGRHRTADKESVLGMYPFLDGFYEIPDDQIREQSSKNRQGRGDKLQAEIQARIKAGLATSFNQGLSAAKYLENRGIPREFGDSLKGVGHYTRGTVKTDLHNALHFLGLRNDPHAQQEIRVNAEQIEEFVKAVAPVSHQSFLDYHRNAMTFMAPELPLVGRMLAEDLKEIPIEWYQEIKWTRKNKETGAPERNREASELDSKVKKFFSFVDKK